jgi:GTP cyclohydrolase II
MWSTSPERKVTRKIPEADFPSRFGHFRIFAFSDFSEDAIALKLGDPSGGPPLVRIHSQCL